jgi:hypothetical protein
MLGAVPRARIKSHGRGQRQRCSQLLKAPAKKEVGYFSAMPADGIIAAHRPCEDFGFSRSKRQLFEDYGIVAPLECG